MKQEFPNDCSRTTPGEKSWSILLYDRYPTTSTPLITSFAGSLARAGKVKAATPKVDKQEKPKQPKGRARKRLVYTRRFVNVTLTGGKRKMNPNPGS
ncbi:ribosomal S30/ubiquitin fusion [Talaromyces stipitatus ATCC 10500]|uniref:Ribosomal S30/ubiquitin fusion n=1 Tax=Talaromyces stipitatus (strain ATCC 10500 / CBS 375.48 / QM 6759 / NRRL 1006) TaxID=441959 RepID=B8MJ15_TALSN|nr:ribosomal S30/ubiquitin fusion [Talaromyces stipitatus ATCC 10500]EED15677.1 ribosomal S30/ubiquitin fusion [Talaromyces stipitatus ATCC 10500]